MDLYEIVMKLNGQVCAVGDHGQDMKRLAAIKELTALIDQLLQEISYAARTAGHHADSMNQIGTYAKKYLKGVGNEFSE